ncbi:MAG TPA: hypothetical protein DE060_19525 [Lentisphaeria bacterium]|nr:hypothetical protein [Lentisphaeria bacterium]HCG51379.1 hypothetical protein [Lentisphaeria bacterium]
MLKRFTVLLLALFACSAFAEGFLRTPDGCIEAGGAKFRLSVFRSNWIPVDQGVEGVVTFPGEGATPTDAGMKRIGKFNLTADYSFDLTEIIDNRSEQELRIQYLFSTAAKSPTQLFAYKTYIPMENYEQNPVVVDGKPCLLEGKTQVSTSGKLIRIPVKNGVVEISGKGKRQVILTREGRNLRINYVFGYAGYRKTSVDMTLKFIPYKTTPVDLSSVVNMGFKDETADDKKGGWTDQGAENDLSMIKSGTQNMGGISFNIINAEQNGGKSCFAMAGAARPNFAKQAKVSVPSLSGQYLYLLNGLAWAPGNGTPVGKIVVSYSDGTSSSHILKCNEDTGNFWNPRDLKNANVVWKAQNSSAMIGLYATKIPLQNKPVTSLEFVSQNQVWMIVAASIGTAAEKRPEAQAVTLKANADWMPFSWDFNIVKGSAADGSFLLDAPAGKYGVLKVVGDRFEFEKRPGESVRFWGANICNASMWHDDEKDAIAMLDNIASRGYNIIRLHHFDWGLFTAGGKHDVINPDVQKKMDFLVSEAKKRGIYITLDLYTIRNIKTEKYGVLSPRDYKRLCYIDRDVRNDLIRRTKDMLGHRNPYTGLTWAEDPAFAMINLINEGTLTSLVMSMPEKYAPLWEKALAEYASKNNITLTASNKLQVQNEYITWLGKDFFDELKKEIRALGGRMPLCDQNYASPSDGTREYYDYVDTHLYWCHPQAVGKQTWGLPTFVSISSPVAAFAGGIKDVFYARYTGKPMVVSEWGYCYPNPHSFEGEFLMSAYSSLQGYNGLMQFCYSENQIGKDLKKCFGVFLLDNNPGHALSSLAGSLMFLRGDIASAKEQVLATPQSAAGVQLPLIMRVGLVSKFAPANLPLALGAEQKWDKTNHLQIRKKSDAQFIADVKKAVGLAANPVLKDGTIASATGELKLNAKKRRFQAVSPKSEAVILDKNDYAKGKFMRVKNGKTNAVFYIGSLDNKPLTESKRMMLIHLTDIKNEGIVFSDSTMTVIKDWGSSKLLLRKNIAEIGLAASGDYQLFACAANGKHLAEIPLKRNGNEQVFKADNSVSGGVMLYELVRK